MIRFLNLKNQINDNTASFAFYDTVTDSICEFNGETVFDSIEEFKLSFDYYDSRFDVDRFISLIPKDYFDDIIEEEL